MNFHLPRDSFNSIRLVIQTGYIFNNRDISVAQWRSLIDGKDIYEKVSRSLLFFRDIGLIEKVGKTEYYHLTDTFMQIGKAIVMKEELTEKKIWRSIVDKHPFFRQIAEKISFYQELFGFIEKRKLKEEIIKLSAYENDNLTNKQVFDVYASTIVNLLHYVEIIEYINTLRIKRTYKLTVGNEYFPPEIKNSLRKFREDYPDTQKTAFIIMQFGKTTAHQNIVKSIKQVFDKNSIVALRADDKQYHDSLLGNVLTYIYGCNLGIGVFERIEADRFNPNVSFEVGYMRALNKPVCLLKDQTMSTLQTDLLGELYKSFDPQDPKGSIPLELEKWLQDKEIV